MGKFTRLFIDETRRHISTLEEIINALAGGTGVDETRFEGRRLSHSIKGMALFEEQQGMADLSYALEKGFERVPLDGSAGRLMARLREGLDLLASMTGEVERHGSARIDPAPFIVLLESLAGEGGEGGA